jgi:hypothetical protein
MSVTENISHCALYIQLQPRTHCMASMCTRFSFSAILLLCTQLLLTHTHFVIALWMLVRLSVTSPTSSIGYGGPWWGVSRRALNHVKVIWVIDYKRALSVVAQKMNCSRQKVSLVTICGSSAKSLSALFSHVLCNSFFLLRLSSEHTTVRQFLQN